MMITLYSPSEIGRRFADRVRRARLDLGWVQAELASRAGIALGTYRKFEQTGQISLERAIQVSAVLGRSADWEALLAPTPPRSMAAIEATWRVPQRGRRQGYQAGARRGPAGKPRTVPEV